MTTQIKEGPEASTINDTARRFVGARLADRPLKEFPGQIPDALTTSYAIQDAAIKLWADDVAGWKIGRIPDPLADKLGANRLAGPIFRKSIVRAGDGETKPFKVYTDGFAAVEAEFILVVGEDAPADKLSWTREEARALVRDVACGVELAGSPLASINDLGPTVIVSDFGNNAGLLLGPSYDGWRERPVEEWRCETFIDGVSVGAGAAGDLPGGPFEALRFLLELNAARGCPLRAGDLISSGAVTGVHDIKPGQSSRIVFEGRATLLCDAMPRSA